MNRTDRNRPVRIVMIIAWIVMFITPVLSSATMIKDWNAIMGSVKMSLYTMGPGCVLFFLNYFLLIPMLFFGDRNRKIAFFTINALLIAAIVYMSFPKAPMPEPMREFIPRKTIVTMNLLRIFTSVCVNAFILAIAIGVKAYIRSNELVMNYEQERRNAAEAELSWLKNQLNPHFLFNTLNNISSLTQIDADKAQDSIGQLSDLLRYALYDSDNETVPVEGEIEFMQNYVNLMTLRCNELTKVNCSLENVHGETRIAPLLFISLIENAFKHGVNARKESFVNIDFRQDSNDLVFTCENSLFPKQESDHIGSGIGLENMKKRLDIIYPGKYDYECGESDGKYKAVVRLKSVA